MLGWAASDGTFRSRANSFRSRRLVDIGEASMITRPCIVVPGIQGSTLQNFYPIDPVTTWSTMAIAESKLVALDFNSLALTDDGLADRGSLVVSRPSALIEWAYAPLVSGLQ